MELNVWTSSTVTLAEKDASGAWIVNVTRVHPDGTETKRVLRPGHVVFALGLGAGAWNVPKSPKQVVYLKPFVIRHTGLIHVFAGGVRRRGYPRLPVRYCEEIRWKEGYCRWSGHLWPRYRLRPGQSWSRSVKRCHNSYLTQLILFWLRCRK